MADKLLNLRGMNKEIHEYVTNHELKGRSTTKHTNKF
jgi:hypothetical protein